MSESNFLKDLKINILIANGMKGIIINFQGSGDSGGIEEIQFLSDLKKETTYEGTIPEGLEEKIEEIGYEYIDKSGDIDFNNDGCSGRFIIDLEKKTIKKENESYYTESTYNEEEWNLK